MYLQDFWYKFAFDDFRYIISSLTLHKIIRGYLRTMTQMVYKIINGYFFCASLLLWIYLNFYLSLCICCVSGGKLGYTVCLNAESDVEEVKVLR